MTLWQTPSNATPASFTGDFRRTLQTHVDAIILRDIELYALTLGPGDTPCLRDADGTVVNGRDAILAAVAVWFADSSWAYHPRVLWTFEQERTAIAMMELSYGSAATGNRRAHQLLVFHKPHDGWRLILDQRV